MAPSRPMPTTSSAAPNGAPPRRPLAARTPEEVEQILRQREGRQAGGQARLSTGSEGKSGSRSPSRGRDDNRSSSRSPSQERGAIGSRKSAVQHSADGSGFWYQDPEGKKVSPVYTYDVLEKLAGKSRHELDFPVILSSKSTPQARATLCGFEGKPGHEHASSSAHMPPFGDFATKAHQLFGQPTSSRASTSARSRP